MTTEQSLLNEGGHVLIIEDNMENFVQIRRLLLDAGVVNPQWKSSGAGAVQLADSIDPIPDLILLDLGLPNEDGYDILRRMRGLERFAKTRIIAVTGRTTADDMRQARAAGFDGFLGKPLDAKRFPGQIVRILHGEAVWERT